ncbi:hypothetical protein NDU88_007959 [Pleurodeles waltl]|uniref:Uncharacterized protein n=1 Tax=Pleurodeles waltl TaxID=8319 RepID=A0AAV7QM98_PLEWA|nr:hypothetical protein NDU88_007959 [Pleurodeles waltl]
MQDKSCSSEAPGQERGSSVTDTTDYYIPTLGERLALRFIKAVSDDMDETSDKNERAVKVVGGKLERLTHRKAGVEQKGNRSRATGDWTNVYLIYEINWDFM